MPKIFEINKNQPDSQQSKPRAVIAILPFLYTEVNPIRVIVGNDLKKDTKLTSDKLDLRNPEPLIADPSEILSLTITDDKKSPIGTMTALLQPSQYNYLEACNPGDYIFAWICPSLTTAKELITNIRQMKACNDPKYGLKFFGKIYSCEETFQMDGGVKIVRYNLSAQSFDYYQTQVFNTPESLPFEDTSEDITIYSRQFFQNLVSGLTQAQQNEIFHEITFNAQDQVSYLHQAFMGAQGNPGNQDALFKSFKNMFALPHIIGKLFGRDVQNQNSQDTLTFSDIMNIIIGVQNFDDNTSIVVNSQTDSSGTSFNGTQQFNSGDEGFGPNFSKTQVANAGLLYQPDDKNLYIKGLRLANITPSMQGTIWQIIKEHSNPLLNEMYTCLRMDPKANLLFPTFICRQLPFSYNLPDDQFSITYFDDLPRFRIDPSNILSYSLNKNNELRMNMFFIQPLVFSDTGNQQTQTALTLANVGYQIDAQDARKHGVRPFLSQVYENFTAQDGFDIQRLGYYTKFIRDINSNLHLKLNGTLTTWGITDFVCIGENIQIGDNLLLHIERITHSYVVQNGAILFRTYFDLSHGVGLDPDNLSTIGSKSNDSGQDAVFTEFKPSFNVFSPVKKDIDGLSDVRGNSFSAKTSNPDGQKTLDLDKTNDEE